MPPAPMVVEQATLPAVGQATLLALLQDGVAPLARTTLLHTTMMMIMSIQVLAEATTSPLTTVADTITRVHRLKAEFESYPFTARH